MCNVPFQIVWAGPEHAEGILELYFGNVDPEHKEVLKADLEAQNQESAATPCPLFAALKSDRFVGCMNVEWRTHRTSHADVAHEIVVAQHFKQYLYIVSLATVPEFRNQGVAETLLRYAVNYVAKSTTNPMAVVLSASEDLINFYKHKNWDIIEIESKDRKQAGEWNNKLGKCKVFHKMVNARDWQKPYIGDDLRWKLRSKSNSET